MKYLLVLCFPTLIAFTQSNEMSSLVKREFNFDEHHNTEELIIYLDGNDSIIRLYKYFDDSVKVTILGNDTTWNKYNNKGILECKWNSTDTIINRKFIYIDSDSINISNQDDSNISTVTYKKYLSNDTTYEYFSSPKYEVFVTSTDNYVMRKEQSKDGDLLLLGTSIKYHNDTVVNLLFNDESFLDINKSVTKLLKNDTIFYVNVYYRGDSTITVVDYSIEKSDTIYNYKTCFLDGYEVTQTKYCKYGPSYISTTTCDGEMITFLYFYGKEAVEIFNSLSTTSK